MASDITRFTSKISRRKVMVGATFAFFVILASVFLQRGSISESDVVVTINGPDSFKAQERVEFELKLENKSEFELNNVLAFVALPEFLTLEDSGGAERSINFSTVPSRGEVSQKITLFSKDSGKSGDISVRAEYSPENLQGKLESMAEKQISVSSLPLTVIFNIPTKAVSGQRIRPTFYFVADEEIETLPLFAKLVLPEGFSLEDFEPAAYRDEIWKFDKIEPGKTYQVEFEGVINGEENDNKKFEVLFGNISSEGGDFAAHHKTSKTVNISSSPLDFVQEIRDKEDYIVSLGEKLDFSISYSNKSGVDIEDISITARLIGNIFDLGKLEAGSGYFNKSAGTIVWNKDFFEDLKSLPQGESGKVSFSVPLKNDIAPLNYKDKNIFGISRAVLESSKVPLALKGLSLRAEDNLKIKLRTAVDLFTRAYYYEGPFSNSGSIPPRVGEKTTYTILWQVTNTFNDIRDVRVEAPLPSHVDFEGDVYPEKGNFKYNEYAHSVLWDIGALSSAVGSIFPVETIAFQVSVTPDENMRGKAFELIEQSKISGTDTFTEEFLEKFAPSVFSSLPDDIGIREGDGVVE